MKNSIYGPFTIADGPQCTLSTNNYTFKILYIPNGEYLNFNAWVYGLHYFNRNPNETKHGIYCVLKFIVDMMNEKPEKYVNFRKINNLPEKHIFNISEFEVIYD